MLVHAYVHGSRYTPRNTRKTLKTVRSGVRVGQARSPLGLGENAPGRAADGAAIVLAGLDLGITGAANGMAATRPPAGGCACARVR